VGVQARTFRARICAMQDAVALVLAGGEGKRLFPLTWERSKPAVYFGGRYRLIDFVLSNLVNSRILQIKVLTQYRATSLVRHLARAWSVAPGVLDQYIDPVPATMNIGPTWFRGTADAIWQNLDLLREQRPANVLVFGADHIYKMDVREMLDHHDATGADLTVSTVSVPRAQASAFGCVEVDGSGRVVAFHEKPTDPPPIPGRPDYTLASMGNYVFRTPALLEELRRDSLDEASTHDFGRDILSSAHRRLSVHAYDFAGQLCPGESERARGYWRDVGTIDAYFEESMDLVSVDPHLNVYNDDWPIRGIQPTSGPCKFVFSDAESGRVGMATDSIVGAGAIISGGQLHRTVCFHRVHVHSRAEVRESVLFPNVDVGRDARLRRCIVDKGVRIPAGEVIGEDPAHDRERFVVSDGGVVVVSRAHYGQTDEFDVLTSG
jgi:glucose-1-phosphate adenylyltransferase